jgi:phosphohistidine phosphatase SixA
VILLVRHGRAGKRGGSGGDDSLRPLDGKGRRQAATLADILAAYPVTRVLTSPYLRCVQTVEPLALRLGIAAEQRGELAEGTPPGPVRDLLSALQGATAVVCTHGDIIAELIGPGREAKKGSVWVLDGAGLDPVEYLKT